LSWGGIISAQPCPCLEAPLASSQYEVIAYLGVDTAHGRYGEVTLRRCRHCGCRWLHYQVEYEAFSGSGRYFMGLITPQSAETLTAEAAVSYLNSLDWHLYGGSYFGGKAGRTRGKVQVDL
jgi:hypothetical protein